MPRGRMLNKEVSVNQKLPKVSVQSRLLFTWMIPHLDVEGKFFGNPEQIKGIVVPYLNDFTIKKIKNWIEELAEVKLVLIYGKDCKYLYFPGFHTNQHIVESKEAASFIPDPTPEELQSLSVETPRKVKESKVKTSKDKNKILFGETVLLTLDEKQKLIAQYGEENFNRFIKKLDDYKIAKGTTYKSDYRAILNWVVEAVGTIRTKNIPSLLTKKEMEDYTKGWLPQQITNLQSNYDFNVGTKTYTIKRR